MSSENTDTGAIKGKKKNSGQTCCVVGCNSRGNKNPGLSFYGFPNKPWESQRRKIWITSVRRETVDGKPWEPSKFTKICSLHFKNGKKCEDPRLESFNPTIFPNIYRKKNQTDNGREKSLNDCISKWAITKPGTSVVENIDGNEDENSAANDMLNDPACNSHDYSPNQPTKCNAATQTSVVIIPNAVKKIDVAVGDDEQYRPGFMGFSDVKNDLNMKQLCGINLSVFNILLNFITPGAEGQPKYFRSLNSENRLLLFLMKMKLGLTFTAIGIFFHVSGKTASKIFDDVLTTIFENTKTWIFWPIREAIKETMPLSFQKYPNCRVIIDCTEIRVDTPPTVEQRAQMYSSYKSCFTVKYLVGISPSGMITFLSKGYGGRSTDGFIVNDSGFINLVEPGDEVMADKGFPQIKTELFKRQCVLIMPPFAFDPQFTKEEVLEGYNIASVRIHVERAIQRMKIFKILEHVNVEMLSRIDKIVHVACALANTKEPIIKNTGQEEEKSK